MTPEFLQDALIADMRQLLQDLPLLSRQSEAKEPSPVDRFKVFKQDVPLLRGSGGWEDGEESPPYVIVRLMEGEQKDFNEPQLVELALIICVYDNALTRAGSLDVLHAIQRIQHRFACNRVVGQAVLNRPPKWVMQQEDTHPYYFGAVSLSFEVATQEVLDDLA